MVMLWRKTGVGVLAIAVVVASCTASPSSAPSPSMAPPSPSVRSSRVEDPSTAATTPRATPTTEPTDEPTTGPTPRSTSNDPLVGTIRDTVVDRVRVRSAPHIADDSQKLVPLLPERTPLLILDGPVADSGYSWYEVVPLSDESLPKGWVASASRDGEPWIGDGTDFQCPEKPRTLRSLEALPRGVGLACFSQQPITVRARLVDCDCDVDPGGWFDPDWFSWPGEALLVDSSESAPPTEHGDWFGLYLDPDGSFPVPLPVSRYLGDTEWSKTGVVDVTGIFDHPTAATCTSTFISPDGSVAPTNDCRLVFATTKVEAVEP